MAKVVKKKTHGGKRPGAGRKPGPEGRTVIVTASVPGELADQLDRLTKREGWNRSEAITVAIRGLLDAKR